MKTQSKYEAKGVASGKFKPVCYRTTRSNNRASKQLENVDPHQSQQEYKEEKS